MTFFLLLRRRFIDEIGTYLLAARRAVYVSFADRLV